jgi:hypothetical protein
MGISSIPTLLLMQGGREISRIPGAMDNAQNCCMDEGRACPILMTSNPSKGTRHEYR